MKYALTGAAGHISKPLAEKLLKAGHQVTVIGRNADHLKPVTDQGAKAAIGSVNDPSFLTKAFAGMDAVYTMVPPIFDTTDWNAYIAEIGKNYSKAIGANGIKHVVNLSSIGAHRAEGCGPISGLYRVEQALNSLDNTNVKHLRPSYFFANLLANVPLIKNMNIMGSNFGGENFTMVLVHTLDVADAAAEELLSLKFTGHTHRYVGGDERSTGDIAATLGASIGKPQLPWIVFSDDEAYNGMVQAGLPPEIARNYAEMGHAFQSGIITEDYWKTRPPLGKIKLDDFAREFSIIYNFDEHEN